MKFYIITLLYIGLCEALEFPLGPLNESLPFAVSIQKFINGFHEHVCVGTLITPDIVLTSSDCIVANLEHLSVACNERRMSTSDKLHRHSVTNVAHLSRLGGLLSDKTALFKINPPILHNTFELPQFDYTYRITKDFQSGVLLGWANLNKFENKLIESLPFRKLSTWTCFKDMWKVVRDSEFCAIATGHRGACTADAGAPLLSSDFKYIYGLLQSGTPDCSKNEAYVFTDIRSVKNWINDMLAKWGAFQNA